MTFEKFESLCNSITYEEVKDIFFNLFFSALSHDSIKMTEDKKFILN